MIIIIIIVIVTIVITVITPSGVAPSAFVVRWHHILKHLLLGPSDCRADLQPLRALPPRASSSAAANVMVLYRQRPRVPAGQPWISFFCHGQRRQGSGFDLRPRDEGEDDGGEKEL
jgi:hypothetical protein